MLFLDPQLVSALELLLPEEVLSSAAKTPTLYRHLLAIKYPQQAASLFTRFRSTTVSGPWSESAADAEAFEVRLSLCRVVSKPLAHADFVPRPSSSFSGARASLPTMLLLKRRARHNSHLYP